MTASSFWVRGINLANIIKDLNINSETGKSIINECIEVLEKYVSGGCKGSDDDLTKNIEILKQESDKSVPHRVLAAKNGAHKVLMSLIENELQKKEHNVNVLFNLIQVLTSLANQQPDIFEEKNLEIAKKQLSIFKDNEKIACATLQWLAKACILHEINRQNIVKADIITYLKPMVSKDS